MNSQSYRNQMCLATGKLGSEDDIKEEFKEERDLSATHEEGFLFSILSRYSCLPLSFAPSLSSFSLSDARRLLKPASLLHFFFLKTCPPLPLFSGSFPFGAQLCAAHTGNLCLIFKGLGPSTAGQEFARYGQKKTFRSVPKLQLELSTEQLGTRGLCRLPSETSDHVRLSLSLFPFFSFSLSLFSLCIANTSYLVLLSELREPRGCMGQFSVTLKRAVSSIMGSLIKINVT